MPTLSPAPREITARHLAGGLKSSAKKTLAPEEMSFCENVRSNKDGGRFPRPGYEDSGIDYSALAFTSGRGMLSAKYPKRLWLAGDNETSVKLTYVDTNIAGAQYGEVFDVGLTLTTGKYVQMVEILGNIYYGNGTDTDGCILVGEVATGGVAAGAATLNVKGGRGIYFPTGSGPYTAKIGTDTFTYTTRSGDVLSGCSGLLAHDAGEVITLAIAVSPLYCTKASCLQEWLACLNLGGDLSYPFTWEFSKPTTASAIDNYRDFSATPANNEMVGDGGKITAMLKTQNFFYVWKEDACYGVARTSVDTDTGARVPQPVEGEHGTPNPRTVTRVGDDTVIYLSPNKRVIKIGTAIEDGSRKSKSDTSFDADIEKYIAAIDDTGEGEWVSFNSTEKLLKVRVFESGVSVIYVHDFNIGIWYKDTNKNYDCACQHESKTYAFDGSAGKLYIDEYGQYDDTFPVFSEWRTGRMGMAHFRLGKGRYIHLHGYMKKGSTATVEVSKDDVYQFTKTITDDAITSEEDDDSTPIGSKGVGSSYSIGSGGAAEKTYPFDFPIGMNHKAEDFSIRVSTDGENSDFVQFDGFSIGITPLSRSPSKHA